MVDIFDGSRECPYFVYGAILTRGNKKTIKVGLTWNLKLRHQQIARQKRSRVDLFGYVACANYYDAQEIETTLHRDWGGGKKRSEYYPFDAGKVLEFLKLDRAIICGAQ